VSELDAFAVAANSVHATDLAAAHACLQAELANSRAEVQALRAEIQQARVELGRARDPAAFETQFKATFLAGMSHELRTPLNAVIGFSELLLEDPETPLAPVQRELAGHVLASGHQLLQVIKDILDLSRIASGRMQLHRKWVSAATLVDSVRAPGVALARQRDVALALDVADDAPDIYGDPLRLSQVLLNLLATAVKLTPPGKAVTLRADRVADKLRLLVVDQGQGMDEDDLPRLFHEFEYLETGKRCIAPGNGLGLVLSRHFAELHGGTLKAESQPGVGSRFFALLPIHGPTPTVASQKEEHANPHR
jgi:signal transduction histidine kinase